MSAKKPAGSDMKTIIANDPEVLKGRLKYIGGSQSDHWNNILANQAIHALWLKHSDQETHDRQYGATVAALVGIGPKDELEGMMATAAERCRTTGMTLMAVNASVGRNGRLRHKVDRACSLSSRNDSRMANANGQRWLPEGRERQPRRPSETAGRDPGGVPGQGRRRLWKC